MAASPRRLRGGGGGGGGEAALTEDPRGGVAMDAAPEAPGVVPEAPAALFPEEIERVPLEVLLEPCLPRDVAGLDVRGVEEGGWGA